MNYRWRGVIEEYRKYLPVSDKTPVITLLEGNTPLLEARNLAEYISLPLRLLLKYEGANPTGSFKDRGMTVAISKAVEEGAKAVICASTGNTSASAAAYGARAKLPVIVIIPKGAIALGKLAQALLHNAKVVAIEGNFDDALRIVVEISQKFPVTLVNSLNPYRIEGQKTAAFEISDVLGDAPAFHALPVGNAGNITAYWKGYKEYHQLGINKRLPRMLGFQAAGAAPIVEGRPIENPQTVATAIRIGNPASWKFAVQARDESGGLIDKVTDEEIIQAYKLLASLEGIFCEPASAASVAGVIKKHKEGYFKSFEGETIVCTLTGHGLKDPQLAVETAPATFISAPPDLEEVVKILGL
ncbi:threonine synthase [bacterium]|nr:threonine synthase [bacterium]